VKDKPALAGALGAFVIAFSAILVDLSNVEPVTATLWRNAYAIPVLGALAWREHGHRTWRQRRLALIAGVVFAINLTLWHEAIDDVGAGLATVLGNLQVVIVPFIALLLFGEKVPRTILYALPFVCAGVLLVSGALEHGAYGANPARGAVFGIACGISYATFILIQRHGLMDRAHPAGLLFDTSVFAAITSVLLGVLLGADDMVPRWPSAGWLILLALSSQVIGWMLITVSLPRLPAAMTSMILTIQPIGSVLLGALLLSQDPSGLQLAGCVLIVAGLVTATAGARARRRPSPA
jgi:drug/metabolite transporter (DMT)-like permease